MPSGNLAFNIFPALFVIVFVIVIVFFIVTAVKGLSQWNKNNHSPVLTVPALVIAKRTSVSHRHHNHAGGSMHTTSSTRYFATFQVESGDRMELPVSASEYGMLAERDSGRLTFQGTRYLGFERKY